MRFSARARLDTMRGLRKDRRLNGRRKYNVTHVRCNVTRRGSRSTSLEVVAHLQKPPVPVGRSLNRSKTCALTLFMFQVTRSFWWEANRATLPKWTITERGWRPRCWTLFILKTCTGGHFDVSPFINRTRRSRRKCKFVWTSNVS